MRASTWPWSRPPSPRRSRSSRSPPRARRLFRLRCAHDVHGPTPRPGDRLRRHPHRARLLQARARPPLARRRPRLLGRLPPRRPHPLRGPAVLLRGGAARRGRPARADRRHGTRAAAGHRPGQARAGRLDGDRRLERLPLVHRPAAGARGRRPRGARQPGRDPRGPPRDAVARGHALPVARDGDQQGGSRAILRRGGPPGGLRRRRSARYRAGAAGAARERGERFRPFGRWLDIVEILVDEVRP